MQLFQFVPFGSVVWIMVATYAVSGLFVGIFGSVMSIRNSSTCNPGGIPMSKQKRFIAAIVAGILACDDRQPDRIAGLFCQCGVLVLHPVANRRTGAAAGEHLPPSGQSWKTAFPPTSPRRRTSFPQKPPLTSRSS